jgi:hypothetical protein
MEPLTLQHVNVKLFLEDGLDVDFDRVVEVFHRWVSEQSLPGLLIDVANYLHVPAGPGILLIGLQEDYSIDHTGSRYGLRYNRKDQLPGENVDRLREAVRSAANVASMLEGEIKEAKPLRFGRRELEIFINDRALVPNTEESWTALQPVLESFLEQTLGHRDFSMRRESDQRKRFGVLVKTERPFDLAVLSA